MPKCSARMEAREVRSRRRHRMRLALTLEYSTSSLRQMADRRGVSIEAVRQQLARYGVPRRPRGGDWRRFRRAA